MSKKENRVIDGDGVNPTGKRDPNVETQRNGKGWMQGAWILTSGGVLVFSVIRTLTLID